MMTPRERVVSALIAAPSHAIQVGTPPQNVWAMLEAVLGKSDFEQALHQAKI